MEGVNQKGSSSTTEALGAKGSSSEANSSTSGLFSVLFPPPAKEQFHFLDSPSKRNSANQARIAEASAYGEKGTGTNKPIDSYFREEKSQPFNYDSSIYYGGQDVLIQPPSAHNAANATRYQFKQDGEDDANMASRGNWWQGSLYY